VIGVPPVLEVKYAQAAFFVWERARYDVTAWNVRSRFLNTSRYLYLPAHPVSHWDLIGLSL
jgi:hypothetical protein